MTEGTSKRSVMKRFLITGPDLEGDISLLLTSKARNFGLELSHTFQSSGTCEVVVRGPEESVLNFWKSLAEVDLPPRRAKASKLEDAGVLHQQFGLSTSVVTLPTLGSFTEDYAYGAIMTNPKRAKKKKDA